MDAITLAGFNVGERSSKGFENLCENISHIPRHKRLIGKAYTYTVERINRLIRHYLARFSRKSYC